MTLPQEPRNSREGPEVVEVVEETVVVPVPDAASAGGRAVRDPAGRMDRQDARGVETALFGGYREWDRSEWVGEGQEPVDRPAGPPLAETEPRWTKWEWVGEGQGEPGPRRGVPAAAMPDGENAFGGHRHNPGMAHWRGSRLRREEPALP